MRTRSSSNLIVKSFTIPKRSNRRHSKHIVKPELRTIVETPVATMGDTRTMSELLQAPTEGYGDAIGIPTILAEIFELNVGLLQLTTNLKTDITNFQQRFDETFSEAWDRFKDLLRTCPHHGFLELHQIDTFYNALTQSDQDSLNAAASGNLLNRTPRDALTIIENKLKVRISQNKPIVSKVSTTTSPSPFLDVTALNEIIKELVLMNKATQQATMKATEETCVTCGGLHHYYECLATDDNTFDACAAVGTYNQGGNRYRPQGDLNYRASNQMGPPDFPPPNVQNSQNYNQNCGVSYDGPTILPTSSPLPKEAEREPEVTKDKLIKCLALADLGASINLMHLFVWKKLSLPELTATRMTLELANRSIAYPVGVAEDIFVKVGKFHFLSDFIVVDYDVDPRVPLILGRPFLRTARALIDVYGKELTLRFNDEAITFNVGDTSSYSYKYDNESVNRIDVIDVTCEEYAQEVLGFLDSLTSGNPTPSDPIIASSSLSFTPFEGGDFILEEIETFLHTPDDPSNLDDDYYDTEGDIL
ncbi:reverse transcriptase domain-containing protein [Tanacetum coccineum]